MGEYSKLDIVKTMGTGRKSNAVLGNIKINQQQLVDVDMNCQRICKILRKKTTEVKIFFKSFGGGLLF